MPADTLDSPQARPVQSQALDLISRRLCATSAPPWLHEEVARRMVERLQVIRLQPGVVADWWAANGASRQALHSAYAKARHVQVDLQAGVVSHMAPWWSSRRWLAPAVERQTTSAIQAHSVELVWANMMLHWVAQPQAEMQRWHRALVVDGFLMFSTLGPGSLAALRALYARLGWGPAHAPFVDMHDLGDMLVHAGFAAPVMDQEVLALTWPDAEAALRELRSLGGNADPQRFAGLRTPRWREGLLRELDGLKLADGRLRIEFEVVYGHAFKPAPRPRLDTQTRVPLDDMRAMVRSGRRTPDKPDGLR
jgi:malonyl-CoA O-methyltransferase